MEYRFRSPTRRPEDNGAPPPRYRRDTADGMIIERDVAVPVRGGVTVYADVFRPADERPAPPLIAWSPYGKHAGSQVTERYPDGGVAPGQLSGYAAFESPDPLAHQRELKPRRGEIVPLDIEILPSGTRFGPGETLRLVIQGTDIYRQPRPLAQTLHDDSVNRGPHLIHTGGRFDSHLLVPYAPG
jgi:predicted acyl esterase